MKARFMCVCVVGLLLALYVLVPVALGNGPAVIPGPPGPAGPVGPSGPPGPPGAVPGWIGIASIFVLGLSVMNLVLLLSLLRRKP